MKFNCNQQTLSKALNIVSKAVTTRTTIPILKGILLKAEQNGKLTMSASDLDITIENIIDVEVSEPGEVVVYAKLFGDIIRKLPNQDISIAVENNNVIIRCMYSEFNVVALSPEEFPKINEIKDTPDYLMFDKEVLKGMIRKTSFAASIDESKGVITGLLLELKNEEMNMVAIDGYRMAIARENMLNKEEKNIIISAKIFNEINKILSEVDSNEENVRLFINDKKAVFIIDNLKVVLRLMEGEFVNYRDILPKESKCNVIINRSELMNSIERASLLSKEGKNNLIRMKINNESLQITSKSEEGNVKEEVIAKVSGEPFEIGFNAKYLIDVLKSVDDEKVKMLFNTNISPCLIKPVESNYFEYLILPVRITNS